MFSYLLNEILQERFGVHIYTDFPTFVCISQHLKIYAILNITNWRF